MGETRTDERDAPRKPRRRWVWPVVLGLLGLLIVTPTVVWWRAEQAERGLRGLVAQLRAAGEPTVPADLETPPIPPDRNAVPDLRAAAKAIDVGGDPWAAYTKARWEFPLSGAELAQAEAVVEANRESLRRVEAGVAKGQVDWGVKFTTPMMLMNWPDLNEQRELALLLHGAALVEHERGNDRAALRHAGEILFVGRAVGRTPILISYLVSVGITALGCDAIVQIVPDLRVGPDTGAATMAATRGQVKALIAELLDEQEARQALVRAFRGERVSYLDSTAATLSGRMNTAAGGGGPAPRPRAGAGFVAIFVKPMFHRSARVVVAHLGEMIQGADAPDWPAYQRRVPKEPAEVTKEPKKYMLASIFLPSIDRVAKHHYRILADRRLAAVCLAARLYAIDHGGQLPAKLEDLVPDYLPAVPLDPLTAGKPLQYVADPDRPRVYSVGDNEKDDGGNDPDPNLSPAEQRKVADEVRHLKRQPKPAPPTDDANEPRP